MRVRDWMSTAPVTVTPATPVGEARKLMRLRGVRHLPVVDGERVVGMLSDRDVRITDTHLDDLAAGKDVTHAVGDERSTADAMSAPAHVIGDDGTIREAARMMLSRRISAVPVIDDDGKMVGLLTTTDCLLAFLSPEADDQRGEA